MSFEVLFRILRTGAKINIGGFMEKTLKKENGLRFLEPFLFIVLTKAIGRGVIADDKYLYN